MAREPSQKLVDYGIIAGIALAAYFVYTAFFKKEAPKECPVGQHAVNPCEGQIGWPAFLCNLGRNVTGAALDCKPDTTVVCLPGYNLVNGVCEAIGPGGCPVMAETCDQILPAGSHFLNEATCKCESKKYTDECTLGTNDCPTVGSGKGILHECIFVPLFGNRWQTVAPGNVPCGGLIPPVTPKIILPSCAESECTPGEQLCSNGVSKICVPLGTGCEDRGFWANTTLDFCKIASNIVDCSCGKKIDLNNPPGTTCESACAGSTMWPLGEFKSTHEEFVKCEAACNTGQRDLICWGSAEVCAASGATLPVPDHPGTYTDAAYLIKQSCRRKCQYG